MARCLLALGSNLGDRRAILSQACAEVARLPDCQLLARSRWHATAPIGGAAGQGEFLNGAILLETTLEPKQLAQALQEIESRLGRERAVRWDARKIDIDMLLYASQVIEEAELTVPHPRLAFRTFVLEPAAEIAGAMLHPTSGWTIARLLAHLHDSPRYVVVTAREETFADWLVSQLCQNLKCTLHPTAGEISTEASDLQPGSGIKLPENRSGVPPTIRTLSPCEFRALATCQVAQSDLLLRPALVIALDVGEPHKLRAEAESAGFVAAQQTTETAPTDWLIRPGQIFLGLGPLARITVDDPATILQEAEAALRCIWPDIP